MFSKKSVFIIFSLFLITGKVFGQTLCKEVIGYYPSWQWYDRNKLVSPTTLDYSKYSIINYAFLEPKADGSLMVTDPWADKNLLLGTINWAVSPAGYDAQYDLGNPAYHNPNTSFSYYAHQHGVEIMMSIGGWTLSNNFPSIAASATKRTTFAHNCNKIVRLYNLDGIDIDWEYPGYVPNGGTVNDKANFTLLMTEVRDSLDALEIELATPLKLTAAFGAAPDRMADIEWNNIVPLMDYINLMSYDFFGAFDPITNHNAPLYAPAQGDSTFNINSAVKRLINNHNVPANKINVGVAFYGRSAITNSTPGLHVPSTGNSDGATFGLDAGTPLYYNILLKKNLFNDNWDATAQVPYLTGQGSLKTFLSYDDEKSIGLKGKYVVDNNLAGVIIWEITGDYIESSTTVGQIVGTPLADTLAASLCLAASPNVVTDRPNNNIPIKLYPNPSTDYLNLDYNGNLKISFLTIYSAFGGNVFNTNTANKSVDISTLTTGLYLIIIETNEGTYSSKFVKE